MKTETITLHTEPVRYKFHSGGSIHHYSTVVLSKTRGGLRQAIKRFWLLHPHVQAD